MEKLWSRVALRSGEEVSQICTVHTWVLPQMLFTALKRMWSHRKPYTQMTADSHHSLESCNARWRFQMVSSARSSLAWRCLLLNILPAYNPLKSQMLPQECGDKYQPLLFRNCWHLNESKDCRLAALMQRANCLHLKETCDQCCHYRSYSRFLKPHFIKFFNFEVLMHRSETSSQQQP